MLKLVKNTVGQAVTSPGKISKIAYKPIKRDELIALMSRFVAKTGEGASKVENVYKKVYKVT